MFEVMSFSVPVTSMVTGEVEEFKFYARSQDYRPEYRTATVWPASHCCSRAPLHMTAGWNTKCSGCGGAYVFKPFRVHTEGRGSLNRVYSNYDHIVGLRDKSLQEDLEPVLSRSSLPSLEHSFLLEKFSWRVRLQTMKALRSYSRSCRNTQRAA